MKFSSWANQGGGGMAGGRSVRRFNSAAPARAAEFISNVLTPLIVQIETSSGARATEVSSVRSDSMIYGVCVCVGGAPQAPRVARAGPGGEARRFDRTGSAHIWRLIAVLISK